MAPQPGAARRDSRPPARADRSLDGDPRGHYLPPRSPRAGLLVQQPLETACACTSEPWRGNQAEPPRGGSGAFDRGAARRRIRKPRQRQSAEVASAKPSGVNAAGCPARGDAESPLAPVANLAPFALVKVGSWCWVRIAQWCMPTIAARTMAIGMRLSASAVDIRLSNALDARAKPDRRHFHLAFTALDKCLVDRTRASSLRSARRFACSEHDHRLSVTSTPVRSLPWNRHCLLRQSIHAGR